MCATLIALLLTATVLLSSCSDSPTERRQTTPSSEFGASRGVQPEPPQTPPAEPVLAAPSAGVSESQASAEGAGVLGEVGEGEAVEEQEAESDGPRAAAAETRELRLGAALDSLTVKLSEAKEPVNLYAGPGVDWAVRRVIQPPESITVLGRAPSVWYGLATKWLKVRLADDTDGWVRSDNLAIDPTQLDGLREFHPHSMDAIAVVHGGAYLYQQHDMASPACQIPAPIETKVGGRSLDQQWFLVDFDRGVCIDSNDYWVGKGWVRARQIEAASMLAEVPIVLTSGRWLISPDPQAHPIDGLDTNEAEPWWARAIDGQEVKVLPSPTGEHVLTHDPFEHGRPDSGVLAVINRSGSRTEIGKLYVYSENSRHHPLESHARWSPDGRAIVVIDIPSSRYVTSGTPDFWVYLLEEERSVDLRSKGPSVYVGYTDARFHHDGQSIYVVKQENVPRRRLLVRLTLDGDDWPGFEPIPLERNLRYFTLARDNLIITVTPESALLWTDRGELIGERRGTRFHVLPDGERFAYYAENEFVVEQFWSTDQVRLALPASLFAYTDLQWWPDGRHFAIISHLPSRDSHVWSLRQLRIYNLDGELIRAYRTSGCAAISRLPQHHRLVVVNSPARCAVP